MSLFKLKLKVLLFLIGSIVSFSGQNEELQKNNDNPENYENYLKNWNYFEEVLEIKITKDLEEIFLLKNLNLSWYKKFLEILKKEPFYFDEKYFYLFEENSLKEEDFETLEKFYKKAEKLNYKVYDFLKNEDEKSTFLKVLFIFPKLLLDKFSKNFL